MCDAFTAVTNASHGTPINRNAPFSVCCGFGTCSAIASPRPVIDHIANGVITKSGARLAKPSEDERGDESESERRRFAPAPEERPYPPKHQRPQAICIDQCERSANARVCGGRNRRRRPGERGRANRRSVPERHERPSVTGQARLDLDKVASAIERHLMPRRPRRFDDAAIDDKRRRHRLAGFDDELARIVGMKVAGHGHVERGVGRAILRQWQVLVGRRQVEEPHRELFEFAVGPRDDRGTLRVAGSPVGARVPAYESGRASRRRSASACRTARTSRPEPALTIRPLQSAATRSARVWSDGGDSPDAATTRTVGRGRAGWLQ